VASGVGKWLDVDGLGFPLLRWSVCPQVVADTRGCDTDAYDKCGTVYDVTQFLRKKSECGTVPMRIYQEKESTQ
jgi:hypothetical protein